MFNVLLAENRAIYEIMWKSMLQPDRPQYSTTGDKKCIVVLFHCKILLCLSYWYFRGDKIKRGWDGQDM
jgi:hypothetical protein